jgi:hypothetical protein
MELHDRRVIMQLSSALIIGIGVFRKLGNTMTVADEVGLPGSMSDTAFVFDVENPICAGSAFSDNGDVAIGVSSQWNQQTGILRMPIELSA